MKQFYLVVFLVFSLQFGFGQLGFEKNVIIGGDYKLDDPISVHSVDIDGDGDNDVITAIPIPEAIIWYENIDGNGNYVLKEPIFSFAATNSAMTSIWIYPADIDGDGDIDVISGSYNNVSITESKISWFENLDGSGTFGSEQIISYELNNGYLSSIYADDLDNDGDLDVLSSTRNNNDRLVWYENLDGNGTFGSEQIITTDINYPMKIHTGDVDSDGDIDVLSASSNDDKIAWYENLDGQGNFGMQQVITNNADGARVVLAVDFDQDGDLDVMSASHNDGKISWFENIDGQGNFGNEYLVTNFPNGVTSAFVGDMDGDGDLDITSSTMLDPDLTWYENIDGQGGFGNQQSISNSLLRIQNALPIDIDGDGWMDIVSSALGIPNGNDKVVWFKNLDGLGNFESERVIGSNVNGARSVFASDLDGDGDMDVISASADDDKIAWYENFNGQGVYTSQKIISTNVDGAISVFSADIDSDGDEDVLCAGNDKVVWYKNLDGQGDFSNEQMIFSANGPKDIFASDLDGDGDIDVLSASSEDDRITWYENLDGQGTFTLNFITINADGARSVHAVDLDSDGDLDVLSASYNDDKVVWYENLDGQANFSAEQIISNNADGAQSVYASDIDGDGDMDILSASSNDNKIAWYKNLDGQGFFSSELIITTNANSANTVFASDLDGDGDMDVLSASLEQGEGSDIVDGIIAWYENLDGNGTFGLQQVIDITEVNANSVYSADIDNDGFMDVLSLDSSFDEISWYKNLGIQTNEINGTLSYDINSDNCNTGNSIGNLLIETSNSASSFSAFNLSNGFYQLFPGDGNFTTQILNLPTYYTSNPVSQTTNFTGIGNIENIDFCIEPTGIYNDLIISIYPSIDDPRPGFDTTYQLVYKNVGTTQLSGTVSFEYDSLKLNFQNASGTVSSQTGNTLNFDFTDLNPFETRTIDLEFNVFVPPTTNIDDILVSNATINSVSGDETEEDNTFTLEQPVIGSYDPNDITVLEGDEIFIEDADKYLHYIIRFQNTGTASAINVRIEHILDDKLDWTTMQLESLSHIGRVEIENETDVSFIFNNINLPDNTNDESNSNGYIAFKIKPKSNVQVGDIISGIADIYFDFNPPIITNIVNTEILETLSIRDIDSETVKLYPNPTKDLLSIKSNKSIESVKVYNNLGQLLYLSTYSNSINLSNFNSGIYIIELKFFNQSYERKTVIKK